MHNEWTTMFQTCILRNGHLNVHKIVKPFRCPCSSVDCDKSYCDARSLRRHLEHAHNIKNAVVQSNRGVLMFQIRVYMKNEKNGQFLQEKSRWNAKISKLPSSYTVPGNNNRLHPRKLSTSRPPLFGRARQVTWPAKSSIL